jgi:hypothetical protein
MLISPGEMGFEYLKKGKAMKNEFKERRSEPRSIIDRYYSVEFSIRECPFTYQFKIWDISQKGICVLVKEDSDLLKYIRVNDILDLKYYTTDSTKPIEFLNTKIRHITQDDTGRFKGLFFIGLSISEKEKPPKNNPIITITQK